MTTVAAPLHWISLTDASREKRIPYNSLYLAVRSGKLRAVNRAPKGTRWMTTAEWIDEWLNPTS